MGGGTVTVSEKLNEDKSDRVTAVRLLAKEKLPVPLTVLLLPDPV
jgi:hypothetical protein